MRITVSGNQREEEIGVGLYIQALLTVAEEIASNSKQGQKQDNSN